MKRVNHFARTVSISALLALTAFPVTAHAGEADRARAAIAEAKGKIEAGDKVGASSGAPMLQTEARASLGNAELLLARGKKTEALAEAKHAGELADIAIVNADKAKMAASRDRRLDAEAAAASAQQSAVAADARANSAEQAAAAANAQADAMRNAPAPVIVAAPPTTTTVATVERTTVTTPAPVVHKKKAVQKKRRVVHHHKATPSVTQKTTTTLSTKSQ